MPANDELDPLDRWLNQQVRPLPPPSGTFELITKRARRRKIRKAVLSVASAAAVAAVVGVAVPVGMSLHLNTTPTKVGLASGASPGQTLGTAQSPLGTATKEPSRSASSAASSTPSTSGSASAGASHAGYLPPSYVPSSVTWDSLSTGWIIGPAGTPGHCDNANPDICTSIAHTHDGGLTWQGLPAPDTGGPMAATGVTGLRFLNATDGWAFGPELWATTDGGAHWHQVSTGKSSVTASSVTDSSVTDLETASGRAYALFGACTPPAGTTGDTIANCTSYTLKTATAGSDDWTPVGGVPANLSAGTGQPGSAVIELAGASKDAPATGYLVAPDGTLYAGPLDGTAWHEVAKLPCSPGAAASDGLPSGVMLAPDGTTSAGATRLAIACAQPAAADTVVYESPDNGSTWTEQTTVGASGTANVGVPQSLTTLPDGTLVLATTPSSTQPDGGIYLLSPGATQWQPAALANASGKTYGFTYVGMTSPTQGVALGGNPALHAIWMTADGGQTWQVRPIQG
ncbi:MAG TPA: hypothetical protein VGG83_21395 [Trebonia sp.]|jgi:hypothetical protein